MPETDFDNQFDNQDALSRQADEDITHSAEKKPPRSLWMLFFVFFVFVALVFLTQRRDTINWVQDYEDGLELARRQNKPVLLAFYKLHTVYTSQTLRDTYLEFCLSSQPQRWELYS